MKRRLRFLSAAFLLIVSALCASHAFAKTEATPEEVLGRLRSGEILTDGGSLNKGVWAAMEGVVDAPPKAVWQLFIQANDWKNYKLPHMIDCRAVDEPVLNETLNAKRADDVYKVLGDRVIDPLTPRKPGAEWTNYTFQYFNMPWPVSDRWYILQNFADETSGAKGIYKTSWQSRAGNVKFLKGELHLEPFEGDRKTHLTYRVEVDLGTPVPRFLIRYGVKKSLPEAMRVIRRESAKFSE